MSPRSSSSNQFKYHKRSSILRYYAQTTCIAQHGWMFAPSTRRSLRSSLFSEGASRIMQDIAVLHIFKGCRWELRAKKEEKKTVNSVHTYVHYIMYSIHATQCACACVRRYSSVFETSLRRERERRIRELVRKKFTTRCGVRRISNLHNALFTLALRASERAQIVYTRTFVGVVKAPRGCFQSGSLARCSYRPTDN